MIMQLRYIINTKRFDSVGKLLFSLDRFDEALDYYNKFEEIGSYPGDKYISHTLFCKDKYIEALDKLESSNKRNYPKAFSYGFNKNDCKITFIGFCKKYRN